MKTNQAKVTGPTVDEQVTVKVPRRDLVAVKTFLRDRKPLKTFLVDVIETATKCYTYRVEAPDEQTARDEYDVRGEIEDEEFIDEESEVETVTEETED